MNSETSGRNLQKARTRRALLQATAELMRQGRSPTIAEAAEAAMISTATAYRYFSSPQSLWLQASIESSAPSSEEIFGDLDPDTVETRVDALIRKVGWRQFDEEALWRNIARASLERWFEQASLPEEERVPVRGESRMGYIADALAPLDGQMPPELIQRLTTALALAVGIDAMIALHDTCRLDTDEAREVMRWAALALLRAAEQEAAGQPGKISSRASKAS